MKWIRDVDAQTAVQVVKHLHRGRHFLGDPVRHDVEVRLGVQALRHAPGRRQRRDVKGPRGDVRVGYLL